MLPSTYFPIKEWFQTFQTSPTIFAFSALSFILLVSSELIVAREGLGYLIGFLGANGSYDAMYAVVLTVAFLGFAADRGYQMLMNRMLQWREQTP